MDSITEILNKLKTGENVDICDIYSSVSLSGKQGDEQRLAALIAYATSGFVGFLGLPTVPFEATFSGAGGYTFTQGAKRASLVATGGIVRFFVYDANIGYSGSVEDGHVILENERIDIRLPENAQISYYSDSTATLYISELA